MEVPNDATSNSLNNGPSYELKFGQTLLENWVEEVIKKFYKFQLFTTTSLSRTFEKCPQLHNSQYLLLVNYQSLTLAQFLFLFSYFLALCWL